MLIAFAVAAAIRAEQLSRVRADPGHDLRHRRARAEHPDRLQRTDLARPWRLLRRWRLHGGHPDAPLWRALLGDAAGRQLWSASRSAWCSDCRHCASRVLISRWSHSRWRSPRRNCSNISTLGPAASKASIWSSRCRRVGLGIDRDRWLYLVVLVVLLIAMRVAANVLNGRTGRAFVAIRDQPIAAAAMGINTPATRQWPSASRPCSPASPERLPPLSSAMSHPKAYSLFLSLSFLVGSAVGGIATIGGAIVGGFFIEFVPNFANDISDAAPWAIYGLAMLLFMYAMPRGVVGTLGPWLARVARSESAKARSIATKTAKGGCHDGEQSHCDQSIGGRPRSVGGLAFAAGQYSPGATTPRSRSATPCRTADRRRLMAIYRQGGRRLFRHDQRARRHQRPQDQLSSAATTAIARPRPSSWCVNWSSRIRCCFCSHARYAAQHGHPGLSQ